MSLAQSLRCISSGYDKCQLCADDYVGRAVETKDPHLPPTSWWGYRFIAYWWPRCRFSHNEWCRRHLSKTIRLTPDDHALTWTSLRLKWLCDNFIRGRTDNVSEDVVHQFMRAYILVLLDSMLFVDKSSNEVRLFLLPTLRDFEKTGSFS